MNEWSCEFTGHAGHCANRKIKGLHWLHAFKVNLRVTRNQRAHANDQNHSPVAAWPHGKALTGHSNGRLERSGDFCLFVSNPEVSMSSGYCANVLGSSDGRLLLLMPCLCTTNHTSFSGNATHTYFNYPSLTPLFLQDCLFGWRSGVGSEETAGILQMFHSNLGAKTRKMCGYIQTWSRSWMLDWCFWMLIPVVTETYSNHPLNNMLLWSTTPGVLLLMDWLIGSHSQRIDNSA